MRYDANSDAEEETMTFSTGLTLTRNQLEVGGFGALTDSIFRFARSLHQMELDDTEYALLSAICLASGGKAAAYFLYSGNFLSLKYI